MKCYKNELIRLEVNSSKIVYNNFSTLHRKAFQYLKLNEDEIEVNDRYSFFTDKTHENGELEYFRVEPQIGNLAIEVRRYTNDLFLECEFFESMSDAYYCIKYTAEKYSVLSDYIMNLGWHRTFTVYKKLTMKDIIRGLGLTEQGVRIFSGKIGSAINSGELTKLKHRYQLIAWKRKKMLEYSISNECESNIRLRAKKYNDKK